MYGELNLVSESFPKIGNSELFDLGQNASSHILTVTLKNTDLADSQLAPDEINFIEDGLPTGSEYRIYRTTSNGGNYTTGPFPLITGTNTINTCG